MYFAMKSGPVAFACLNLLNDNEEVTAPEENAYRAGFVGRGSEHDFSSIAAVDSRVLPESDVEALKVAWDNCSHLDQFHLCLHSPDGCAPAQKVRTGALPGGEIA